ncbi:MAG: peptidylprolyl isomerase [Candidatus Micrarchaeota archaeon]|nr:peptidylprolyl isomerase [Candidatus Micrarchaeota archaeon]
MELKKGDLVRLEFTGRISANDQVFETTDEKVAKDSNIYDERQRYKPRLVFYEKGDMIKGLEKELPSMELNVEKEFVVKPEEAFGMRYNELTRTMPVSEFEKRGYKPAVGMAVDLNGSLGVVRAVSGGRVVIDFNHPLAGMELKYKVKVLDVYKTVDEKLKALIDDFEMSDVTYSYDEKAKKLSLLFKTASLEEAYFRKKYTLIDVIKRHFDDVEELVVNETYRFERKSS